MISIQLPSEKSTLELLDSLSDAPFSYGEVGCTRDPDLPLGYNIDRYQLVIGSGEPAFDAAKKAIQDWTPFAIPWIRTCAQREPIGGCMAAVMVRVWGLWWTNVSRVVYTVETPSQFGFAYGTLNHHAECGEERFLVDYDPGSEEVTYSVLAFSKPRHPLARLGYPFARMLQRRFGAETLLAMSNEVASRTT